LAAGLAFGATRNSEFSTIAHLALSPSPPWEIAAWATMADETESDPARPRNKLGGTVRPSSGAAIDGIAPPAPEDRLQLLDFDALLNSGMTPIQSDDFDNLTIVRMITTFQVDDNGNASTVFLDITTPRTLSALRFTFRVRFETRYPRHKLSNANDQGIPNVITPAIGRDEVLALHDDTWVPQGWVELGADDRALFAERLRVERDNVDVNRLNFQLPPDLINGAHILAALLTFRL
jgi:phage tail sheath gpL-like